MPPTPKKVDHNNPIPFYVQLLAILEDFITSEAWQPDDRLPSEAELCQTYDVSRTVVRQTLRELEHKGLIVKRKGKGSFVAHPKINESLVQKLTGFYQDMLERGYSPITKVLHFEVEPASPRVASHLELETGTPVFNIERLRYVRGEPIVLVTTYLPQALCPQLAEVDLSDQSLYAVLEKQFGLIISYGRRSIEAVLADEREAELLEIELADPLLLLNSVSRLSDGTPVEYYHALHRGDRSRFDVNLVRVHDEDEVKMMVGENVIDLPDSN